MANQGVSLHIEGSSRSCEHYIICPSINITFSVVLYRCLIAEVIGHHLPRVYSDLLVEKVAPVPNISDAGSASLD